MISISNTYDNSRFVNKLSIIDLLVQKTQNRLATGNRINSAGDDSAGLVLAKRLEIQMRGLGMAGGQNYYAAQSIMGIADGTAGLMLNTVDSIKELVLSALNDPTIEGRMQLQNFAQQLISDFFHLQDSAKYGGKNIFEPSGSTGQKNEFTFQLDDGFDKYSTLTVDTALNIGDFKVDFTDYESTRESLKSCYDVVDKLLEKRGQFGSAMNTLEGINDYQSSLSINLTESYGRIMHADFAKEISDLIKTKIMFKATASLFAQSSKISSNSALKLLEGLKNNNDWRCHV